MFSKLNVNCFDAASASASHQESDHVPVLSNDSVVCTELVVLHLILV